MIDFMISVVEAKIYIKGNILIW